MGYIIGNSVAVSQSISANVKELFQSIAVALSLTILFVCPVNAETHIVEIRDFDYLPKDLQIAQGDRVKFVWKMAFHDAVAGNIPTEPPASYQNAFRTPVDDGLPFEHEVLFDRDMLVSFPAPGNLYKYYCTPHFAVGMVGSISVVRSSSNFKSELTSWQVSPPTNLESSASCTATLSADESTFSVSCNHSIQDVVSIELRDGFLGDKGSLVCQLNKTSDTSADCTVSQEQANRLWSGANYIVLKTSNLPDGALRGQVVRESVDRTIEGEVRLQNGSPLPGVIVSNGVHSATTNNDGFYRIQGVDSGVYQLQANLDGYTLLANEGVSPVVVNANNPNNRNFTAYTGTVCLLDSDGDGICDSDENNDGSNPADPGSYREHTRSPGHLLWNSFLGMINIVALINRSDQTLPLTLTMYDLSGKVLHTQVFSLTPNGETDIIVNDLPNFVPDSFGVIELTFSDEFNDRLDAQMFFYKPDQDAYQFAFGVPIQSPQYGDSAVAFNTFQPSTRAGDEQLAVLQWLSIVNLDRATSQSFTIIRHNQNGAVLSSREIDVPAFGRVDIEGGHVNPGPSSVGMHRILPSDKTRPYIAQLLRYGGNTPITSPASAYHFAFPLRAKSGNGEPQTLPITQSTDSDNWVELINSSDSSVSVELESFAADGSTRGTSSLELPAYAQQHIYAGDFLELNEHGYIRVTPNKSNSLIGQSMFYVREVASGAIDAMYGIPLQEPFGTNSSSSYNLFLGMANWLRLSNTSNQPLDVTLSVFSPEGTPNSRSLSMDANSTLQFGLHEEQFGTRPDTFGVLRVESSRAKVLSSDLLRIRRNSQSRIDIAAPIPVR
jgi:plastocyanin